MTFTTENPPLGLSIHGLFAKKVTPARIDGSQYSYNSQMLTSVSVDIHCAGCMSFCFMTVFPYARALGINTINDEVDVNPIGR